MLKLDNKGFAISGILYATLILFLVLMLGTLSILASGKFLLDKTKNDLVDQLNNEDLTEEIVFTCGNDFTDSRDNNTYKTTQIENQCWMAENLRYTDNGCLGNAWSELATSNACVSQTTSWGEEVLYQLGAVMNGSTTAGAQGLCPDGWHIPTDEEWETLFNNLGGDTYAGGILKAEPNYWDGTDEYHFNALPSGYSESSRSIYSSGEIGKWWSSSIYTPNAWSFVLYSVDEAIDVDLGPQYYGLSVRCLFGQ